LSASSDATIKLWSLTAGRCIATYNSYDGASVWSLFSEDPQLRCFHSGTRDGLVTKHWLNDDDSEDCVVPVLRESAGVCRASITNLR
jgi:WD repeat-containing protein 48